MKTTKAPLDGILGQCCRHERDRFESYSWSVLAVCIALLSALLFFHRSSSAEELSGTTDKKQSTKSRWITAGWLSWHFRHADKRNAANIGIGLEVDLGSDWTIAGGIYNNSFNDTSVYAGGIRQFWVRESWRLGLMLGAVNGYRRLNHGGLYPYVFPMLQYQGSSVGLNLALVPPVDSVTEGLIAVQLKFRF
jgi:hypothetical protein